MKHLLPLLGLLIPATVFAAPNPFAQDAFADVPATHTNYTAIEYLRKNNVLKGYSDGLFHPERRINRAEFVKLIASPFILDTERLNECLRGISKETEQVHFSDVVKSDWFAPEVCLAKTKRLIDGYPDGTFRAKNALTFVEAAKIISNTFSLELATEPTGEFWYRPYVEKLAKEKAIPTSIRSNGQPVTRAQVVEMLYRLKTHTTNQASRTAAELR